MSLQLAPTEPADGGAATSVSGPASGWSHARRYVIAVSGDLSMAGTSWAGPTKLWEALYLHGADATGCGPDRRLATTRDESETEATRRAVSELRRISGLTWQQLGRVLGVSRRSVHYWASGEPLNAENRERLMDVLQIVRAADRGSARSTRAVLLDRGAGATPFDLLAARRFEEARLALGRGRPQTVPALAALSAEAKAARRPLPPEELHDAKTDRVHRELGRGRAARVVRSAGPTVDPCRPKGYHLMITSLQVRVPRQRDPALDALLDLAGETLFVDDAGHWVQFVVVRTDVTPARPHGLSYSLTLHAPDGSRLVGFDNAHAVRKRTGPGGRTRTELDHRHRLRTVRAYEYQDAATLLEDFWREVDSVLRERGTKP